MVLAASLAVGPFSAGISFAAEPGLDSREYPQLNKQVFKTAELSKEEREFFSDKQLIIKYSTPLSASEHRQAGGKLVKRVSSLGYDVIEVQGKKKLDEVAKGYAELENVTSISKSAYGKTMAVDPKTSNMYHLGNLNIEKAQKLSGKNKVKVGVIDTGLDAKHPDLKNNLSGNVNIMDPMKKGTPDTHGTHVAGIIGAEKGNGIGGYGIAPNADIISIDVFNRSFFVTDYHVAEGIMEAIRQDVKVINMSLGFYSPSPILEDAVKKAVDKGIIVVAAAGNDGASVLNYPASFDNVIAVGATDDKNKLASFSTYGPSVDVVAPGHNVYSTYYDVDKGSSFIKMSGTSMASPVVAGTVALLLSKYPDLTPYQVSYMLNETAKDLGDKGYDLKYGFGLVDPVKLMSYNPASIPAEDSIKQWDILEKAVDLGSFEEKQISGKMTKLNQKDFYQVKLKQGEKVQVQLTGNAQYDLQFELLFYQGKGMNPYRSVKVNDVSTGLVEGTLFEAPMNGTLVVAIKDSFGKYDPKGQYEYELALQKTAEFEDSKNTLETPVEIKSLPYVSENHYFTDELGQSEEESSQEVIEEEQPMEEEPVEEDVPAEEGTDGEMPAEEETDVEAPVEEGTDGETPAEEGTEEETPADEGTEEEPAEDGEEGTEEPGEEVEEGTEEEPEEEEPVEEVKFRGVPGGSDFFRFTVDGKEEDGLKTVKIDVSAVPGIDSTISLYQLEKVDGDEYSYEMDRVSNYGYGKGETLVTNAMPGVEYMVEVTNKPYIDEFMIMYDEFEIDYERNYSSMQPYKLSIESKELTNDEDGLPVPFEFPTPEEALMEGDIEQFIASKKAIEEVIMVDSTYTFNQDNSMIKDMALPMAENETKSGYIQTYGDEDYYAFTPEHNSIFEVNINPSYPVEMNILKWDEEYEGFSYIYSNWNWTMDGVATKTNFTVGLQEGETYYFRVTDPMYRPGVAPYRFSVSTKIKNTADDHEVNDTYAEATKITTEKVTGNFSGVSDVDMYYFKPEKAGVYSARVTPGELPYIYSKAPAEQQSAIDPVLVIIEDSNGNGKLDAEEQGNQMYIDYALDNEEERTGFKTKKDAGYFITTTDYYGSNSSLVPYVLKVDEINLVDEDKGSTVKNNVPSKPIALKKNQTGTGYLNITSNVGDSDFYKLNVSKNKTVKVTLDVPSDIDGKVTIYSSKGTQVATLDSYGKGDDEIKEVSLKKGTYYLKVEDVFGNASASPYTLSVE